jgi:predicted nucleic acid-binding protein
VLIFTRGGDIAESIDTKYSLINSDNKLYISVVTVAELKSIILQRDYGTKKIKTLEGILSKFRIIDINIEDVLNRYAEIDAYSQGKLKAKKGSFPARNMGKNDLYIAATSSVYDLVLITTDNDFNHLSPEYIKLENVNIEDHRKSKK